MVDDCFPFNLMEISVSQQTSNIIEQKPYSTEILEIVKKKSYEDELGRAYTVELKGDRMCVVHEPSSIDKSLDKVYPCVFFFHGLGNWAWTCALKKTIWREVSTKNKFYVVFAQGTDCGSLIDKSNGFNVKYPEEDFEYLKGLISYIKNNYQIDSNRLYYAGYSNGAIFSSLVAQEFGSDIFAAISNSMGGFGKESKEVKQYKIFKPLPIYIITGDNDDYKESCVFTKEFFEKNGFIVKIDIIPNKSHSYPKGKEKEIWDFFNNFTKL